MSRRSLGVRPVAALFALIALQVLAPVSSRAASPVVGPLRTSGNLILDGNGVPLILRGVNIARMHTDPSIDAPGLNETSFNAMQRWGVNVVRLSLGQQFWLSTHCKYVPTYANRVDTIVSRITGRGMVAMLSLARVTRKPCGHPDNHRMADQASLEFWRQVAERYRSNPLVSFDLFNEPHDISWGLWKNGGNIKEDGMTWKASGMQELYNKVRSTGAQNLVFVSGNHWGSKPPDDNDLLSGFNIVYAKHQYTCTRSPPPNCTKPQPYNPAPPGDRLTQWLPLIATHPVHITEFGWPSQYSKTYNQNVIDWAESHGIGWAAFAWTTDAKYALLTDWKTFNPTTSGTPIANGLTLNR